MYGSLSIRLFHDCKNDLYRYSEEPFQLSSGGLSHHYFNCRKITLHPERLALLGKILRDELIPQEGWDLPEAVGGLTLGADPIGIAFSLSCIEKGQIVYPLIVRKEAKGHGLKRRIEGEWERVRNVVALDDVVTTGSSTIEAIRAFREAGLTVQNAICVVDREEGGSDALAKEGVRLLSVFRKSDFLESSQAEKK